MREKFFSKNHTHYGGVMEKLFQADPFPKYQNYAYFWINSLKFYTDCFTSMLS